MESRERYRSLDDNGVSKIQPENDKQEVDQGTPDDHLDELQAPGGERSSNLTKLKKWKRYLILIFTPIILLPLPLAVPGSVRKLLCFHLL